jgi:hypothetical protein
VKSGSKDDSPVLTKVTTVDAMDVGGSTPSSKRSSIDTRPPVISRLQSSLRFPVLGRQSSSVYGSIVHQSINPPQRLLSTTSMKKDEAFRLSRNRRDLNDDSTSNKIKKAMAMEDSLTNKGLNFRERLERYEAVEALLHSLSKI